MTTHAQLNSSSVSQNQKAHLATAYNELGRELSSTKIRVVGNYTLGKVIGEGAYGKVRLGTHRLTSTKVAIKQIPKAMSSSLTREIHHHRRLHHPNVTQLYEVIATESSIWLVTELCSGGELFDYLMEKGRLSEDETKIIFGQLCLAVAYIHDKGIVHRDLKLENVLLDERCRVKLGDFGFTREFDRGSLMETFCGTTGYASPEMLEGRKYLGPEVDVWSLGVILYTLLTGSLPFDDDDESVMREKIVRGDFEDPEWLSDESRDLIKNILLKDASKRLSISQILSHTWFNLPSPSLDEPKTLPSESMTPQEPSYTQPTLQFAEISMDPSFQPSISSAASDATFLSASSELPVSDTTLDDVSNDGLLSNKGFNDPTVPRNPSLKTIRETMAIHTALEIATGNGYDNKLSETAVEEEDGGSPQDDGSPRPPLPRQNLTAGSKVPPAYPIRTPLRTKRRSVSSTLDEPSDRVMEKSLTPSAPQDFASLLSTPAPIIFSTPLERDLLNSLSSLGFDTGQMVHSVLSDACDSTGSVWWMLLRKAEKKTMEEGHPGIVPTAQTATSTSENEDKLKDVTNHEKGKRSRHGSPVQDIVLKESLAAHHSAPELAFVPPTPTVASGARPETPPRVKSPVQPYLSPSPSIAESGAKSHPSSPASLKDGTKSRKGRSGSVSIMQRATTALEAAGIVRKKSSEAVREDKERQKEKDREREKSKEIETRVASADESRSSHGSGSSKLTKSPPLRAIKDAGSPPTPPADPESKTSRTQMGSPWVMAGSSHASPRAHSPTPTTSPGDTLTSLPDLGGHGGKIGHRNRASLLSAFRMWFHEDRKGKRKAVNSGGSSRGHGYDRGLPSGSPVSKTTPGVNRAAIKHRTSGASATTSRKRGYHTKRHSASSRRSSSVNSRRSSTASMQMVILDSPPNGYDPRVGVSRQRSDASRRSFGSHTPNSERGDYPSRPSSARSFVRYRHRKSPSASSAGSVHNMNRGASPLPSKYHKRGGSGSSTRVVRQTHAGPSPSTRPNHRRSNSTASSVQSRTSSRPGSCYEQSESDGQRTNSPLKTRKSLDDTSGKGARGGTTFVAQKRQTPFTNPGGSISRSSWKKSWGLEPPGWQSRSTHLPIEVLAISPAGDSSMNIRDVFSGRHSLSMGDEDDWVDEDDDIPAFAGGLGQMPTSGLASLSSHSQAIETFMLSPPPRYPNGHSAAKRNTRAGTGATGGGGRHKSGHSPGGRSSPLPTDNTFEEPRASSSSRRQLPNGRSASVGFRAQAIQEEDEGEEGEEE